MKTKLTINRLFVYSEREKKYFYTEFDYNVNIIYGKNTSGKSTIFQSIIYVLGINDSSNYLREILEEDVFFRLDCIITKNEVNEKISFIREHETIFIKRQHKPVLRFNGINADNSAEHIKLKEYMDDLFGFSLKLESKNEYKHAPIETMILPYYISQSVGWVYIRKSFSNLDFYKNFKEDYLDYYLGIENIVDRERKRELEEELKSKEEQIKFYTRFEKNNKELQIAKLIDEKFINKTKDYIELYKEKQNSLNKCEEEYISKCNKLSYYIERQKLLKKVSKNHKNQSPIEGNCPVCKQALHYSIDASYKYFQEENDTEQEKKKCKENIKELQSQINSLRTKIIELNQSILKEYEILREYFNYNINYDSWIKNKVNSQLISDIKYRVGELTNEKIEIQDELKCFKTEEEVEKFRQSKNKEFSTIFTKYLNILGVKSLDEGRYTLLYKISAFPYQGVELHKTVLAYNFAFNRLISKTKGIHRFPFMLDAIFKEDIDELNKNQIVEFISKYKLDDTQLILSIAEIKQNEKNINEYNETYFDGKAKLICIGRGTKERAFLQSYDGSKDDYLEETLNIIN